MRVADLELCKIMAQPSPTAEPSMEEILASIRRIISDEHSEQADEAIGAPAQAQAEPQEASNAGPIPITDTIDDAPQASQPDAVAQEPVSFELPEPAELPEAALDPTTDMSSAADLDLPEMSAPVDEHELVQPEAEMPPLELTEETADQLVEPEQAEEEPFILDAPIDEPEQANLAEQLTETALTSLPAGLLEPETDAAVASGFKQLEQALAAQGRSIDELTDDILRPMVKTWLDDNLPQLVERLVREEIQRVARGS